MPVVSDFIVSFYASSFRFFQVDCLAMIVVLYFSLESVIPPFLTQDIVTCVFCILV